MSSNEASAGDNEARSPWVIKTMTAAPASAANSSSSSSSSAAAKPVATVIPFTAMKMGPARSNGGMRTFVQRHGPLFNSLAGILHTFIDYDVVVELEDESSVAGRLLSVNSSLDILLASVTMKRRGHDAANVFLERLRVTGQQVRYVRLPSDAPPVKSHVKEYVRLSNERAAAGDSKRRFNKKARGTAAAGPVVAGFGPS